MKVELTQKQLDTIVKVFDSLPSRPIDDPLLKDIIDVEAAILKAQNEEPDEPDEPEQKSRTCPYCGSGLFNEKGDCENCGL